jgi:transcriptional regulator with XRE-family HTH domain
MSKITEQIGLRLRAARRAAHFRSARTFAAQHTIPESTYSQHETGKRALNPDMLLRYSELLGINPGWLLTGEGMPYSLKDKEFDEDSIYQKIMHLKNYINISINAIPVQKDQQIGINEQLFNEIFRELTRSFAASKMSLTCKECVDFCAEVYNNVVASSIAQKNHRAVINLSIASLKRGIKKNSMI